MCVYVQFRLTTNRRVAPRRRSGYAKSHNTHIGPVPLSNGMNNTLWVFRISGGFFSPLIFSTRIPRERARNPTEFRPRDTNFSADDTHTHTHGRPEDTHFARTPFFSSAHRKRFCQVSFYHYIPCDTVCDRNRAFVH